MNKALLIFLFEILLWVVFLFFYMGIWTSPKDVNISERFMDTGFVAAIHLVFAIGGALVINVTKD